MAWFKRSRKTGARAQRRSFVTPEGVDLQLTLGGAAERGAAFLLDALFMLVILIGFTLLIALLDFTTGIQSGPALGALWLLGFFLLRNGWFTLFEMSRRGATPGKRILGLRVVARDGARLTGGAVLVRNAMREIEIFLPLTFLLMQSGAGTVDKLMLVCALAWSGIFLLFPLFNRDRLRVGDLLAGTWVVHSVRAELALDLVRARMDARRPRHRFSEAALDLYGVFELQTLEDVLRRGNPDAVCIVAASIRRKAGMPDEGDDFGFLSDYYAALCARLERDVMLGSRRENKYVS